MFWMITQTMKNCQNLILVVSNQALARKFYGVYRGPQMIFISCALNQNS